MTGYLLTATIDIFLSIFVVTHRQNTVTISFSLLCLVAGVWSLELYLLSSLTDLTLLNSWFHITRVAMFFIAPCLLLFATIISQIRISTTIKILLTSSFLCSTAISISNVFFTPSVLVAVPSGYLPVIDTIARIHQVNFVSAGLACTVIYYSAYRRAIFREKLRLKWLALALSAGAILGVISFSHSKLFGMLGNIICLSITAYAVIRYRLITVSTALSSGLEKGLSIAILLLGFFALSWLEENNVNAVGSLIYKLIYLIAAFEYHPKLTSFIKQLFNKFVSTQDYNLDKSINKISKQLISCYNPDALKSVLDECFNSLVKVNYYRIYLASDFFAIKNEAQYAELHLDENLSTHNTPSINFHLFEQASTQRAILFYDEESSLLKEQFLLYKYSASIALKIKDQLVGFIFLGQPHKTEQFCYNDIKLLNWLSHELGSVIEATMTHHKIQSGLSEAQKTLSLVSSFNEYNHDIKAPLSNIESLVLAGDAFSVEEKEQMILEQTHRGKQLVSSMVRTLNGQHHSTLKLFDLKPLIENAVLVFSSKVQHIQTELEPLPKIFGSLEDMDILLYNLLKNACEAGEQRLLCLTIRAWHDAEKSQVLFSVSDNGVGIEASRLTSLWDKGESSKRERGGTGIGMSVIKRIVKQHNGQIQVDSEVNKGTKFTVQLPCL